MMDQKSAGGAQPHLDGVPLEQLMLVRVQGGLEGARVDEEGRVVLSRRGSGRADAMNTFHFALNGVVTNHVYGRFDHPIAVVAALKATCGINAQRPAGLDGADTYFHADSNQEMTLADAWILAPDGTQLPPDLVERATFYPPGATKHEMLANRNRAVEVELMRRNVPVQEVAPVGWRSGGMTELGEYTRLGRALGAPDLQRRSHMNGPTAEIENALRMLAQRQVEFRGGTRFVQGRGGEDLPIAASCADLVTQMRESFANLLRETGCPHAAAFFSPRLHRASEVLADMESVLEREVEAAAIAEGRGPGRAADLPPPLPAPLFYLAVENRATGPMTLEEVKAAVDLGQLSPRTLAWTAGMSRWEAAAELPQLRDAFAEARPTFRVLERGPSGYPLTVAVDAPHPAGARAATLEVDESMLQRLEKAQELMARHGLSEMRIPAGNGWVPGSRPDEVRHAPLEMVVTPTDFRLASGSRHSARYFETSAQPTAPFIRSIRESAADRSKNAFSSAADWVRASESSQPQRERMQALAGRQAIAAGGADSSLSESFQSDLARRQEADGAFEAYQFGEGTIVVDKGGWDAAASGIQLSRMVYLRHRQDAPDVPSRRVAFTVGLDEQGKAAFVYAIDDRGAVVGKPAQVDALQREATPQPRDRPRG